MSIYIKLQASKSMLNKLIMAACLVQLISISFTSMVVFTVVSVTLILSVFARGVVSIVSYMSPISFEKIYDVTLSKAVSVQSFAIRFISA